MAFSFRLAGRVRSLLLLSAFVAATAATGTAVAEQNYPSQTIRIVVPFGADGSSDIVGRFFGQYLGQQTGQPVVIENKAGANGIIGTMAVKNAAPDGYTLELSTNTTHAANSSLYKKLPYDPLKDFENIAPFGTSASVAMVSKQSGIKSVADLVTYAKAHPDKVFFGYYNSASQMAGEMFRVKTGAPLHGVSYKAIGNAVTDLIGGQVQVIFMEYLPAMPHVKANDLTALGVTAAKRYKYWPNVPAIAESYPGFEMGFHLGLAAPAGTSPEVLNKLHGYVERALADPKFAEKLDELGMEPLSMSREQYQKYSVEQVHRWAYYAKTAGVEPQ
jgi:tripartite-type tricarboxylate transporter receptor subunit TctC